MSINRTPIFAAVKALRGGRGWIQSDVDALDRAIDAATGERTQRFYPTPTPAPRPAPAPAPSPAAGGHTFSQVSLDRLQCVHPQLRQCFELAITYSEVDFGIGQTSRTVAQQQEAVDSGHSRTMKSKHLKQPDGWVWAGDTVVYIDGKVNWDLPNYAKIAAAMDRAATELGIAGHVRWGCAWDRVLSDFGGRPEAYYAEVLAYEKRHAGSDLLDGPHFEWVA